MIKKKQQFGYLTFNEDGSFCIEKTYGGQEPIHATHIEPLFTEHTITFNPDGTMGAIYNDDLVPIFGALGINWNNTKASDVLPEGKDWYVHIRDWVPGGAKKFGPYGTYKEAIKAEVKYLLGVL